MLLSWSGLVSRGRIPFVEEFAGNYILSLHCADPSDVVVLRVRWRGTFVNDSELDKHVFCLVNSKKRHIWSSSRVIVGIEIEQGGCDGVRLNSRVKSPTSRSSQGWPNVFSRRSRYCSSPISR